MPSESARLTPRGFRPGVRGGDLFAHSAWDVLPAGLALGQGALLTASLLLGAEAQGPLLPVVLVVGCGLWWGSNTVSHQHLHRPFFRAPGLNRGFSLYLTLLLGIPQSLWRRRHLWHHAGEPPVARGAGWPRHALGSREARLELASLLLLFGALGWLAPRVFLCGYLPGYALGLALSQAQGYFEHLSLPDRARGGVSYYGRLYNLLWLNDGYHAEHHARPQAHWRALPGIAPHPGTSRRSGVPPILRWLEPLAAWANRTQAGLLVRLERWSLGRPRLLRFMVRTHRRAFAPLLPLLGLSRESQVRVCVVGGGLFPRTLLALGDLLPSARFVLVDAEAEHLEQARRSLAARGGLLRRCEFVCASFDPGVHLGFELVVIPLGYRGDRRALYDEPTRTPRLIHDWLWRRRGKPGRTVSPWLLKRVNLVRGVAARVAESRLAA
ncbi:MAG: fatty acid desaturase [Deltaproteobacteria bacterium]|nr:fatty acid desaturase [Deltaproteobacteria bacterium]